MKYASTILSLINKRKLRNLLTHIPTHFPPLAVSPVLGARLYLMAVTLFLLCSLAVVHLRLTYSVQIMFIVSPNFVRECFSLASFQLFFMLWFSFIMHSFIYGIFYFLSFPSVHKRGFYIFVHLPFYFGLFGNVTLCILLRTCPFLFICFSSTACWPVSPSVCLSLCTAIHLLLSPVQLPVLYSESLHLPLCL